MMRISLFASILVLSLSLAVPAMAQGRGTHQGHPAKKALPLKALKQSLKKLEALEGRLARLNQMGKKELTAATLEVKEIKLQIREFLMDVENRKFHLPAYECCPCEMKTPPPEGKLQVTVNIHGNPDQPIPPDQPLPPTEFIGDPMADGDFAGLLVALKEQGFADDKLTVLQDAVSHAFFTVAQVRTLLKLFSFPDDKLSALRAVKTRIVDPQNNFQLYGSFVHSSDKDEAKQILGGQ